MSITWEDFENALRDVQPSALREVYVQRPNVQWTDVGGLQEVKEELKELKQTMNQIECFLNDAEQWRIGESEVNNWLFELKLMILLTWLD